MVASKTTLQFSSFSVKVNEFSKKSLQRSIEFALHFKRVNGAVYLPDSIVNPFISTEKIFLAKLIGP